LVKKSFWFWVAKDEQPAHHRHTTNKPNAISVNRRRMSGPLKNLAITRGYGLLSPAFDLAPQAPAKTGGTEESLQ